MKLFKIENRINHVFPKDAILIVGKSINFFNEVGEHIPNGIKDGWFIKFEYPFTFNTWYRDAKDFSLKFGLCRYSRAWVFRPKKLVLSFICFYII